MTGTQGMGSTISVEQLCRFAQVSRAAFYRRWHESAPREEETALRDLLQRMCLKKDNRYYGYRRITALLRRDDWCINHKRVLRLMRDDNLLCLRKRSFRPATTDSDHGWRVWPNLARHLEDGPTVIDPARGAMSTTTTARSTLIPPLACGARR